MGFIQPCFIRKNTPEIRKSLEELGYSIINEGTTTLDAHNYDGKGHHKSIEEGRAVITSNGDYYGVIYDIDAVTKMGRIDCGTNEDLFLAIAALRDDTDINQWFTNGNEWAFCSKQEINSHWDTVYRSLIFDNSKVKDCNILNYHKACVEELIKHLKKE